MFYFNSFRLSPSPPKLNEILRNIPSIASSHTNELLKSSTAIASTNLPYYNNIPISNNSISASTTAGTTNAISLMQQPVNLNFNNSNIPTFSKNSSSIPMGAIGTASLKNTELLNNNLILRNNNFNGSSNSPNNNYARMSNSSNGYMSLSNDSPIHQQQQQIEQYQQIQQNQDLNIITEMNRMYKNSPFMHRRNDIVDDGCGGSEIVDGISSNLNRRESTSSNNGKIKGIL